MKNHICWRKELIQSVMDPEALQIGDEYFLATHHQVVMQRAERTGQVRAGAQITEAELLEGFLDENAKHQLFAIIGEAGCGKSHLVRWLWINIPRTKKRRMVLIPKINTNLRSVIEQVLDGMEGEPFDSYRSRLRRATADLTPQRAAVELLNQLALEVGPLGTFSSEKPDNPAKRDEREYIKQYLPALLHDAGFREQLMLHTNVVNEIAEHIVGELGRERRESRRLLKSEDLRLEEWDYSTSKLTEKARKIYTMMRGDTFLNHVIEWINRNLEPAIGRVLNFRGTDLIRLMSEVRRALDQQDKELLILVEDFTKLEGIENQLLEALLVRPEQGGQRLCVMRSIIALTTSRYGNLMETFLQRIGMTVSLDVKMETQGQTTREEIAKFSSRYLNAIRVEPKELREWHRSCLGRSGNLPPPNRCSNCANNKQCHEAFGALDGVGLYPFTSEALEKIYQLAPIYGREPGYFNPRRLIREVLEKTLAHYGDSISEGRFPPGVMLDHFGGGTMRPERKDDLAKLVKEDRLQQYRALIELWGDPNDPPGISDEVFDAFGLERISMSQRPRTIGPIKERPAGKTNELPDELQTRLKEIDEWTNNADMSQKLLNDLRPRLFEHLREYIDWDGEMFVESYYAGPTKAFQKESINFKRQLVRIGQAPIRLESPISDKDSDFDSVALALKGMLLQEFYGDWTFDGSSRYLRKFGELLDASAEEVLKQLRQLQTEAKYWDPVPAGIELLVIGAKLYGKPPEFEAELDDYLNALFLDWSDNSIVRQPNRSPSWQKLLSAYTQYGTSVSEIVKSRVGCTKGGVTDLQIINSSVTVKPIQNITTAWRPKVAVPSNLDDVREAYRDVLRLRRKVDELLPNAIKEEKERWVQWCRKFQENIGQGDVCVESASVLEKIAKLAFDSGLLDAKIVETVRALASKLRTQSSLTYIMKAVAGIQKTTDLFSCLPIIGNAGYLETMNTVNDLVGNSTAILAGIGTRLAGELKMITEIPESIGDIQETIGSELDSLLSIAEAIVGGKNDTIRDVRKS